MNNEQDNYVMNLAIANSGAYPTARASQKAAPEKAIGMHPQMIRAELRVKGKTIKSVAEEIGASATAVTLVIDGRATSARIKDALAVVLGKSVAEIWPDSKLKSGLRRRLSTAA